MGDQEQEKNMENPDTVQKVRGGLWLHQTARTVLVIEPRLCPRDTSLDLADHNQIANLDTGRLDGRPVALRFHPVRRIGLRDDPAVRVFCLSILDCLSDSTSRGGWLNDLGYGRQELRMVLAKPRSREGSVSEMLCNVWLDDARDELVIVYETIKKLFVGSHVSK
ncbi:hypothetical protein Bca52824_054816 [Brassica carinata]|uniref:Uncharacterized protein n=1 Tax=Brassica carinata TaxID=52824 RepID=A0A8X7UPF8_BRACI|nr:hypothetical protein Bca52824_054816 [Brassica carinata]